MNYIINDDDDGLVVVAGLKWCKFSYFKDYYDSFGLGNSN
jgi:hypothetical protein